MLNKQSKYLKSNEHLWWKTENWEEQLKSGRPLEPFVLKMVDRAGFSCSLCNWTQRCSGCLISPDPKNNIVEFLKYCHVAIEWNSQMIEEEFNQLSNEIVRHKSTEEELIDEDDQIITLQSCL